MSPTTGQEATIQDQPHKHDFVTVDPEHRTEPWVGVVTEAVTKNGTVVQYKIQPWDENGPMNVEVTAAESAVSLHDEGRLTVLDDIYDNRFNYR